MRTIPPSYCETLAANTVKRNIKSEERDDCRLYIQCWMYTFPFIRFLTVRADTINTMGWLYLDHGRLNSMNCGSLHYVLC